MSQGNPRAASPADQASFELKKLARVIRMLQHRGDQAVCQRLLSHAHRVRELVDDGQFSQALHVARCRMMG